MAGNTSQDAYNLMVATYHLRCDDFTYELLGNDTANSIFDEIKKLRRFKGVKNNLNVRAFRQRIYRLKKQKQNENLIASQEKEDDEAEKKLKDVEFSTNVVNDEFKQSAAENRLVDALRTWCDTMNQENGEQMPQEGYQGLDDKLYKPFTLNAKSLYKGVSQHPKYTGYENMGFSYDTFKDRVNKLKDRVKAIQSGDADEDVIDLYAIASSRNEGGKHSYLSPQQIEKLKQLTEYLDMSKSSQTLEDLKKNITNEVKEGMKSRGKNCYTLEANPLSDSYIRKIAEQVAPDLVNDSKPQSQRRMEAILDLFNHATMGGAVTAVSSNEDGDVDLSMDEWFNLDKTVAQIESGEFVKKLHVGKNSKRLAKQKGMSLSSTNKKTTVTQKMKFKGKKGEKKSKSGNKITFKKRSVGMYVVTSASGATPAVIYEVKDVHYDCFTVHRLPDTLPGSKFPMVYCLTVPVAKNTHKRSNRNIDVKSALPTFTGAVLPTFTGAVLPTFTDDVLDMFKDNVKEIHHTSSDRMEGNVEDSIEGSDGSGEGVDIEVKKELDDDDDDDDDNDDDDGYSDDIGDAAYQSVDVQTSKRVEKDKNREEARKAAEKAESRRRQIEGIPEEDEEVWEDLTEKEKKDLEEPNNPMDRMVAHAVMGIYIHCCREYSRECIAQRIKHDQSVQEAEENGGPSVHDMTFSGYSQDVEVEDIEKKLDELRLVLSLDGEHFQLQAVEHFRKILRYRNIEFIKWAASCSFVQQPNDLMKGFVIVKRKSKAREGKPPPPNVEATPYYQAFDRLLGTMDKASKNSYMKFFAHSPSDIQTSFSIDNVQKGWRLAGITPTPSVYTILDKWPGFGNISTEQGKQLHDDVINILAPDIQRNGYCNPELMYQVCAKVLDEDDKKLYMTAKDKAFPNALNRWRCTWINHEGTLKKRKEMAEMKANQNSAKKSRHDDNNDQFSKLTVVQLREKCKERKIKKSGNKEALKKRLREACGSSSSSSSSSSVITTTVPAPPAETIEGCPPNVEPEIWRELSEDVRNEILATEAEGDSGDGYDYMMYD